MTPANKTSPVLFDSGTLTIAGGSDLLVAALQNTGPGASPITLLAIPPSGATLRLLDRATPARVRVVHASPDAPAVQDIVNEKFAAPLVPTLAFPNFTPFVEVPGAAYNLKVTPVGNNGLIAIDANVTLAAGSEYSVYAVGPLAITVANGGVYTVAARDAVGGGVPLSVITLDDFYM